MVAHNNPIQSVHLRKKWQFHVKTWFDQPAKKAARRAARVAKAKKAHPRPVNALRPIVRGQTNKYNTKVRAGRGFSLAELRAAKISPKEAAGLGIAVDVRRRNISEEGFQINVERLNAYKARVVVVGKKTKAADIAAGVSTGKTLVPAVVDQVVEAPRALTEEEKKAQKRPHVANLLRQALINQKYYGRRLRKQERLEEDKATADRRAAKKASKA